MKFSKISIKSRGSVYAIQCINHIQCIPYTIHGKNTYSHTSFSQAAFVYLVTDSKAINTPLINKIICFSVIKYKTSFFTEHAV